jgi:N-acetyl-gamma-glutamyl-phosphate reductase
MALQPSFDQPINFIPVRGDFTRGIMATVYTHTDLDEGELKKLYTDYYGDYHFVQISENTIHLKQVVNINFCLLQVQLIEGKALITSMLDNLLKGAVGQAIQCMNLQFGLAETTGLQLKANCF